MFEVNDPLSHEYLADPYRLPTDDENSDDEPSIYDGDLEPVTDAYLAYQLERIAKQRSVAAQCMAKGLLLHRVLMRLNSGAYTPTDLFQALRPCGDGVHSTVAICHRTYVTTGHWTKDDPWVRTTGLTLEELELELQFYPWPVDEFASQ